MRGFSFVVAILCFLPNYMRAEEPEVQYVAIERNLRVHLSRHKLIMTFNQPHFPWYETDTLAICDVVKITDDFLMIRSEDPVEFLQNNMIVSQAYDEKITNGKLVTFCLSIRNSVPMKIPICINNQWGEEMALWYDSEPTSVLVSNSTDKIFFGFEPNVQSIVKEHPHGYTFHGIVAIPPLIMCPLEPSKNRITIYIPPLTDTYFERYYVQDEYIRIQEDCLLWGGILFRKSNLNDLENPL